MPRTQVKRTASKRDVAEPCAKPHDLHEEFKHRDKLSPKVFPITACVARPVPKCEIAKSPGARAALGCEWKRLRDKSVWDESTVREWYEVARDAQHNGVEVNFGYLFAMCVEKNPELPPDHPKRKLKGRVVFQGNRVTNQNWEAAICQDL
eukprot:13365294-Heterocapsa_arctica.AAC.1